MVIASHQPNFLPYMGFFYKMFCSDVFTVSDGTQFSRSEFHNYNFVEMDHRRMKITVPVKGHTLPICKTEICDYERFRKKLIKTIECSYGKAPHFGSLMEVLGGVLSEDYKYISEMNLALIMAFKKALGIECRIVKESEIKFHGSSSSDEICSICDALGGDVYLSGIGAKKYIDESVFDRRGIEIVWINYEDRWNNLSVADYVAKKGLVVPAEFEEMREMLWKK